MIPVETNRFVETSGPLQTINFGVQAHNMKHLMSILRDQLYSDKKLAPIREYSCNAFDANIENDKRDVPIKVTLPNENFHELKIRDYGKGLSYDEMVNIFCSYGESTKRNSNDYIGQLGIGSKSGFAYGDNFMVTSYQHGKKSVYTCVLDKSGIGSLINLISEETEESSGIEIVIPIKESDILHFQEKAIEFYSNWDIHPNIFGLQKNKVEEIQSKFKKTVLFESTDWKLCNPAFNSNSYSSYIIMGNIPYIINWNLVYDQYSTFNSTILKTIKSKCLLIKLPIGTVEISPSRESLQYTETTINVIKNKITEIIQEIDDRIKDSIAHSDNFWDAKIKCGYYSGKLIATTEKIGMIASTCQELTCHIFKFGYWNNIKLTDHRFYPITFEDVLIINYVKIKKRITRIDNTSNRWEILADEQTKMFIDDVSTVFEKYPDEKLNSLLKWYMKADPLHIKEVCVFRFQNSTKQAEFYKKHNFDTVPVVKLSDLIKSMQDFKLKNRKVRVSKVKSTETVNVKYNVISHYSNTFGWDDINFNDTQGLYVYMENNFLHVNGSTMDLGSFISYFRTINNQLKIKIPNDKLYIIGPRIKNNKTFKSSTKWYNILDVICDKLKSVECEELMSYYTNTSAYNNALGIANKDISKYIIISYINFNLIATDVLDKDSIFIKLCTEYPKAEHSEIYKTLFYNLTQLGIITNLNTKDIIDVKTQLYVSTWKQLYITYPLLKCIDINLETYIIGENYRNMISDYINSQNP